MSAVVAAGRSPVAVAEHPGGLRAVGQPVEAAQVGRAEGQRPPHGVVVGLHAALVALQRGPQLADQLTTRDHLAYPFDISKYTNLVQKDRT